MGLALDKEDGLEHVTPQQWAWEFLRRNQCYQDDYKEFKKKLDIEIADQASKGIISNEMADIFRDVLRRNGKDSLCITGPSGELGGRGYIAAIDWDLENITSLLDNKELSADLLFENINSPLPVIKEPNFLIELCNQYHIAMPRDPACNFPPRFTDHVSKKPTAITCHGNLSPFDVNELPPSSENKIAFEIYLEEPLAPQIEYIKKLCKEVQRKPTGQGGKRTSGKSFARMLRILDAEKYGPKGSQARLAKEWNIGKSAVHDLKIKAYQFSGGKYRQIAEKDDYNNDVPLDALLYSGLQIPLTGDDKSPEELDLQMDTLRRQSLERLKRNK